MKKAFYALAMLMALAFPAMADITIGVGQAGRGYEKFGIAMAERMKDRIVATTVNFEGSDAISRALCDGKVQVGIMQIDAIFARQKEGCKLRVVGTYGVEYVFLLVPPNSAIDELDDFDSATRIMVDTAGSGTDLFWQTAVAIEKGPDGNKSSWASAIAVNDPVILAESAAEIGEIDALLMVSVPTSSDIKALIDAGWELVEFYDKDLNDQMYNGEILYPVSTAEVEGTGGFLSGNTSSDSYAIRSFVVLGTEASSDKALLGEVARAAKAALAAKGN